MGMKKGLMLGVIGMALMDTHTYPGYDVPKVKVKEKPLRKHKEYNPSEALANIVNDIDQYSISRPKALVKYTVQGFWIYAINEKNAIKAVRKTIAIHTSNPDLTLQELQNQIAEQEA